MRVFGFFLLVLSTSVLGQNERQQNFINQHIIDVMTEDMCSSVIRERRITKQNNPNECKKDNTFITSNTNTVNAACGAAGKKYQRGPMMISNHPFDLIECNLTGGNFPDCKYKGGFTQKRIVIECQDGLPVHFHKAVR